MDVSFWLPTKRVLVGKRILPKRTSSAQKSHMYSNRQPKVHVALLSSLVAFQWSIYRTGINEKPSNTYKRRSTEKPSSATKRETYNNRPLATPPYFRVGFFRGFRKKKKTSFTLQTYWFPCVITVSYTHLHGLTACTIIPPLFSKFAVRGARVEKTNEKCTQKGTKNLH